MLVHKTPPTYEANHVTNSSNIVSGNNVVNPTPPLTSDISTKLTNSAFKSVELNHSTSMSGSRE